MEIPLIDDVTHRRSHATGTQQCHSAIVRHATVRGTCDVRHRVELYYISYSFYICYVLTHVVGARAT